MNKADTQRIYVLANQPQPQETDSQIRARLDSVCLAADVINSTSCAAVDASILAGLLRWQAQQLNGHWDTEAVTETFAWWKNRGVIPLWDLT